MSAIKTKIVELPARVIDVVEITGPVLNPFVIRVEVASRIGVDELNEFPPPVELETASDVTASGFA
jgi:hypothetical protein